MKKLLTLILALTLILTLTACNKEPADADDVLDYLEDEGWDCYEYDDSDYDALILAVDGEAEIEFMEFEDAEAAEDYYEDLIEEMEGDFDELGGKVTTSEKSSGNYAHNEFKNDDYYYVATRIENTILLGFCYADDAKDMDELFKDLGY